MNADAIEAGAALQRIADALADEGPEEARKTLLVLARFLGLTGYGGGGGRTIEATCPSCHADDGCCSCGLRAEVTCPACQHACSCVSCLGLTFGPDWFHAEHSSRTSESSFF